MNGDRSIRRHMLLGIFGVVVGLIAFTHIVSTILAFRNRDRLLMAHILMAHSSLISIGAFVLLAFGISRIIRGISPVQQIVADRHEAVVRAQQKAGDLAHGLKTPLAVLSQEADRVEKAGQAESAGIIRQQVERMQRQMDYHLSQARAAASGRAAAVPCSIRESAEGLARALQRLHFDRGLKIEVRVDASHTIAGQREDLDEMLGNLLDNACKWAKARVSIESVAQNNVIDILVDDDGPGIPQDMRESVLQRGVRADESTGGYGFGLAIVRDLAALYRGSIGLEDSPLGGLRARLRLPVRPLV